jgi:exodeoxyribonuclease VII large subunit
LESNVGRALSVVRRRVAQGWQRNDGLDFELRQAVTRRMRRAGLELSEVQHTLAGLDLRVRLARSRARLDRAAGAIDPSMSLRLERGARRLDALHRHLQHLSPLGILERGYSIVQTEGGAILHSAGQASIGESLRVRLHEGELGVRVEHKTVQE